MATRHCQRARILAGFRTVRVKIKKAITMEIKATNERFIPYRMDGKEACIQIPLGETYIMGNRGIYIITGMKQPSIESLLDSHGEDEITDPITHSHPTSILPGSMIYTSFDVGIFNYNGNVPVIQYSRNGEIIREQKPLRKSEKSSGRFLPALLLSLLLLS